ncbi:MAG: DUF4350 domain-containing protein [Erythrobacter sp.]|nr:DUF4350 domain-containing protein [Erythrobacter sp.]
MSGATNRRNAGSPFSKGAVLGVVLVGFAAFLAMLYFIAAGDTGGPDETGKAHAYSNGLNGYAGLVQLLESDGIAVERSRDRAGLSTSDLLILTPPIDTDAEEFAKVLEDRQYVGPTLVILPKWRTARVTGELSEEDQERLRRDWVRLVRPENLPWTQNLPPPFEFVQQHVRTEGKEVEWQGLGMVGKLPTALHLSVKPTPIFDPVISDPAGDMLAFHVLGEPGSEYYNDAHWTMFVVEPDLMNNYGLADPQRAAAALALINEAGYDEGRVTFDMTLIGPGDALNLLTLAFQPPFLAATLCLILAIVIIGWRAFLRFGPSVVSGPQIAFGKRRLVTNGAGLIVRANRLGLMADPYISLIQRRLGRALGLVHPDPQSIDQALARRLPDGEPFSQLAQRLHNAQNPAEIMRAASALHELTQKLKTNR